MNRLKYHSSSTLTAGGMVSANVNLHYVGMLQHKFQIFGQIFIEKKFKCHEISHNSLLPPFERGCSPSLEYNLVLLQPWMLCAKFSNNWPVGSGEGDKKFTNIMKRRQTVDKFDQKSSLRPLAQVN